MKEPTQDRIELELDALKIIIMSLINLDEDAQKRILRYLYARFEQREK